MTFSQRINKLFAEEKWSEARQLLEDRLAAEPDNHWLLTRLGTTYYEERNYEEALRYSVKAYEISPNCPLVLWDLASTYEMLGNDREALQTYAKLLHLRMKGIAESECGEGEAWAASLLTDCFYSVAGCAFRLGKQDTARWFIEGHLQFRAIGAKSIYSIREARRLRKEIAGPSIAFFEQDAAEAERKLQAV